jgi:hypothetical protein
MSQPIKIYTDEHIDHAIIVGLRRRGIDVLTTPEAGLMSAPDEVHLARAISEGRVLLTRDSDFITMNNSGVPHSGIIYAKQGTPIGDIVHSVERIYQHETAESMQNVLRYAPRRR